MPVTPTTGTVYRNDHLHIDDAQVHPPKGYPTAERDTYLTKSIHGENIWDSIMFQKPVIGFVTLGSSVSASGGDRYIVLGSSADGSYGDATPNSIVGYLTLDAQGNDYDSWDYRDAETGMLTYVSSDDTYYYFNGTSWVTLATASGGITSPWEDDGAGNVKLVNIANKVGIGTDTPQYDLDVVGSFSQLQTLDDDVVTITSEITSGPGSNQRTITLRSNNITQTSEIVLTNDLVTIQNTVTSAAQNAINIDTENIYMASDAAAGNVGIGTATPTNSKLQVAQGDIEVDDIGKGIIIKSPDATRWRITVSDLGAVTAATV